MMLAERFCQDPSLEDLKLWLEKVAPNYLQMILPFIAPKEPFTVICHGDVHASNVLFK